MTFVNQQKSVEEATQLLTRPPHPNLRATSAMNSIFVGSNGLRAGWRLVIFFVMMGVAAAGLFFIARATIVSPGEINTPLLLGGPDAVIFLMLCAVTWIMGKIEHRKFSAYGLAPRKAMGKDFWIGALCGFGAISGTLLTMFLLHGFRISGLALHGTAILSSLVGWSIAFLLVGLFEEFLFRGYIQYTLTSGIGFWPAAVLMSSLFGLLHLVADPNENVAGSASVVLFGLLLCFFLRRTGNLWCAVGFHFAYDWGQTFFYGVPDSGLVPYHNLFNSVLSGPRWLTGGGVGPEASVLTPIALLVVALVFSRYHPRRLSQIQEPRLQSPASIAVTGS